MFGPTTQCNSKTYYQMFQLYVYVPNLCHWSIIWWMSICWMLDQLSFRCRLNSSILHTEF